MKLDELRKLCDEATPGPWWLHETKSGVFASDPSDGSRSRVFDDCHDEDALFAIASRTLMPKLVKVAEAAKDSLMSGKLTVELGDALGELEAEG